MCSERVKETKISFFMTLNHSKGLNFNSEFESIEVGLIIGTSSKSNSKIVLLCVISLVEFISSPPSTLRKEILMYFRSLISGKGIFHPTTSSGTRMNLRQSNMK